MKKLTNRQMSLIHGGERWQCYYTDPNYEVSEEGEIGPYKIVEAASAVEAADKVHRETGATQVNCTKNDV